MEKVEKVMKFCRKLKRNGIPFRAWQIQNDKLLVVLTDDSKVYYDMKEVMK